MTISLTATKISYTGNGTSTTYAYPFQVFEDDDLTVIVSTSTGASPTTLILNTDYTVTGAGGVSGGNVVLSSGSKCASGQRLTIIRNVDLTQGTDYVDGDAFSADTLETPIDKGILIAQQLNEAIGRAPKFPKSSPYADYELPVPTAGKLLGWGQTDATKMENYSATINIAEFDATIVNTIADLRLLTPTSGQAAKTLHYATIGDGGGSEFYGVTGASAGTYTDNGYNTIVPAGGDGSKAWLSTSTIHNPLRAGLTTTGSGSENQTALTSFIAAVPTGANIIFSPGTYAIAGLWTITKACNIYIPAGCTLNFTTNSTNQGIRATVSNVVIYGSGNITGPQHATSSTSQIGFYAYGANSSNYITGIKVNGLKFSNWGGSGIELQFVKDFAVDQKNTVYDCYNNGIAAFSCGYGAINGNYVYDIVGDGVIGTEVYGIIVSKHAGSESVYPVCYDIEIAFNTVTGCITWEGIDCHGGRRVSAHDNHVVDCRKGILFGPYITTAGSERAPNECKIINNHIVNNSIAMTDVAHGAYISGDSATSTMSVNCKIDGNTITGYGDSNTTVGDHGAATLVYTDNSSLDGNTIDGSGRHALCILGSTNFTANGNTLGTVSGTASVAATGTLTFAANPSDGDTITINGRVFTFKDAPSGNWQIQRDATTLATTLGSAVTLLNGNGSKDGRVWLATYSADATILTITFDKAGELGNYFTINASVATRSAATLTGGAEGSSAVMIKNLSGAIACTGHLEGNVLSCGAYTGFQMVDDNLGVNFGKNTYNGTGAKYDLNGTGSAGNCGGGEISDFPITRVSYNPGSINAAASESFYIPALGSGSDGKTYGSVSCSRSLDGLVASCVNFDNYVQVQLFNPSAGAVDISDSTFTLKYEKSGGTAVALAP